MRNVLAAIAAFLLVCTGSAASAATFVTTGTGCIGSVGCIFGGAALQPFDSSLGELTNIVLRVEVTAFSALDAHFLNTDFSTQTGSAHLSYDGPFTVNVNGQLYTLSLSGETDYSYTGTFIPFFAGPLLMTTGDKSFAIDPTLFDTFLAPANHCGCISAVPTTLPPHYPDITIENSDNLTFGSADYSSDIRFTLNYVFRPVPEPSTWAMILLGFAAIGVWSRRSQSKATLQHNRPYSQSEKSPVTLNPVAL